MSALSRAAAARSIMQPYRTRCCVLTLRPARTLSRVKPVIDSRAPRLCHVFSSPRRYGTHFQIHGRVLISIRSFSQSPYRSATPTTLRERTPVDAEVDSSELDFYASNGEQKAVSRARQSEERWEGGKRSFDVWKTKQKRFARHITNLVRKGKVEEAEQVFQDMLSAKVRPNTVIFNNLIAGVSRVGNAQKAFKYFNNLKKRGLLPTDHTYASLFRACAEIGLPSLPILEKIVSEIDRRGILLNTIATNALIVAMATCGMLDEAFQVYLDMGKRQQKPDVNTFTALLSACARDGERGMERVLHAWQEMSACGVEPDLFCYNTLLQCLKEAGIPAGMKCHEHTEVTVPAIITRKLHSLLPPLTPKREFHSQEQKRSRKNLKSAPFSVISKNQVHLNLFGKSAAPVTIHLTRSGWRWLDVPSVEQILHVLKDGNLKPDIHTLSYLSQMSVDWTVVVRGVGVASSERGVATGQVVPDERCLLSAARLQACLGNNEGTEALRVFGEERGFLLGSAGYQAVAVGCHTLRQGLLLLAQMKEAGVTPDQHTIGTLLGNAASRRDYKYLVALMKEMRHCKMQPNRTIAQILEKVVGGQIPQSPRMKLGYNGFKGYYTIWKKHYPDV